MLAGCASTPRDGPPRNPPPGLAQTPDAEPRVEPIRGAGGTSRPYTVAGRSYTPLTDDRPLVERGLASWYGQGFHARSTATGEPYDMYAMTAAHRTMPLPSYARVRNPANGREVIVRVNDRGPFRDDRIIDLSYTAALRLDLLRGVAPVEVERLTNEAIRTGAWRRPSDTQLAAAPTTVGSSRAVSSARVEVEAVPVPAAWVQPVAAASSPAPAPGPAPAPASVWRLAQASTSVASDAAPAPAAAEPSAVAPSAVPLPAEPPPRFRNMEVAPLAPMTP
ncbi:septal ring lytic transglycosylase RlpA family protein, partial [uncultured Pseudacidovorax sp.]|uniref:septal ring lytic transglycosylase RlpA family protein n=1 Tax=uncultured Pseudacidovorax sp. TaxID=679313 RepID=UPI0025CC3E66